MTSYDIDTSAPAIHRADIVIDAPSLAVWARLSNIAGWPTWNRGVEWISALIPLSPGTGFEMRAAGQTIRGRIQGVSAPHTLCWTSNALLVSARHVLTIEDIGGRTRVSAAASYRGVWPRVMPRRARRQIESSLHAALMDLKSASEGKPIQRSAA